MKKNKILGTAAIALAVASVVGISSVSASTKTGTVTGEDGDIKDKVSISAEVTAVDGSHVTFKDVETGSEYTASFGPSWYNDKDYEEGDKVVVIGVETDGENSEEDHNFQAMQVDQTVLREQFEGKPAWAGTRGGNGDGTGEGSHGSKKGSGNHEGGNFVDSNKDGVCDNSVD